MREDYEELPQAGGQAGPDFSQAIIFDYDLAETQVHGRRLGFNRLVYVGMRVLDLKHSHA